MIDLQWPGMVAGVIGNWLVAGTSPRARCAGFGCFLVSNALWAIWAFHAPAWGLLVMQACFTAGSVRGLLVHRTALRAAVATVPPS